jgi:hypothetical protein
MAKKTTTYRVQKLAKTRNYTASGQVNKAIGAVWVTVATSRNKTVAERAATHARIDNPDAQIRIEERA